MIATNVHISQKAQELLIKAAALKNLSVEDLAAYSLPGDFHKDPADRIIVATARVYDSPLVTVDEKILAYSYVKLITPSAT